MYKIKDKFWEKIEKISNYSDIHGNKVLTEVFEAYITLFDDALDKNALYPFKKDLDKEIVSFCKLDEIMFKFYHEALKEMSKNRSEKFRIASKMLGDSAYPIRFYSKVDEVTDTRMIINDFINQLEDKRDEFNELEEKISKDIQIDVMPNGRYDNHKFYLSEGIVFVPACNDPTSYLIYDVFWNTLDGERFPSMNFVHISNIQKNSLEQSKRYFLREGFKGTIAIAKNTDKYPLEETSIQILSKKYEDGLGKSSKKFMQLYLTNGN